MVIDDAALRNTTVAEKLDRLVKLQSIDSRIDEINHLRKVLPDEILDLEDDISGLERRVTKLKEELKGIKEDISGKKQGKKEAQALIDKYKGQLNDIKNEKEKKALDSEIELQELEIELLNKRIKEAKVRTQEKDAEIDGVQQNIKQAQEDLKAKREDLDDIKKNSVAEEDSLKEEREGVRMLVEERLLKYYDKLRAHLTNGLAVVTVKNGAAVGCNIVIPPQKIIEIRQRKRLIIDEHSGRILASVDDKPVEEEKKPRRRARRS